MTPDGRTPRQRILSRRDKLRNEREPLLKYWRDLSDQVQPWRTRFLGEGKDRPRRNDKIINSTPPRSARVLESGLYGLCDPRREWFRVVPGDPKVAEAGNVRSWCYDMERLFRLVFERSNFYNSMKEVFAHLVTFGTSALHIEPDPDDVIRCYVFPVGQYSLANSARLRVDTCYRDLSMSVSQLVERFTYEKCSPLVQQAWDRREYDQAFDVVHTIEPNRNYKGDDLSNKPYTSCWLELGAPDSQPNLAEEGFFEFPVMCPRWDVNGEDVYGTSPGMAALGDCKELQYLERRYAQLLDKTSNPPMFGPASLLNRKPTLEPGEFIPVDAAGVGKGFAPAIQIDPNALYRTAEKIQFVEASIEKTYLVDVFRVFTDAEGDRTIPEVNELKAEKYSQLGPATERFQDELFDPAFDRVFSILLREGLVPDPPEEMQGQVLKIEFISALAQAGKLVTAASVERTVAFIAGLGQSRADAWDKLDVDEAIDTYADALNAPPKIILSDDKVAAIREERAKQAAEEKEKQDFAQGADVASTLASSDIGGQNALGRVAQGVGAVA